MAEVELDQLAQQKVANAKVRFWRYKIVTDHSKANDEMKALAKSKGITLPDSDCKEQK